jgi:3D-(3,5/4)-trihydroxycyclohexane-1,2-dione acylhydrolase (decyclizing)
MTKTIRLTAAQALVKYVCNQKNEDGNTFIAGCWAIFGHGNVAGLGEALYPARQELPTYRGHNEQTMAHSAIAYAKQSRRRRAMAVTSSIGPGATNMVTAAALAHVNRLPVLLLPGDVFAGRGPDPVLQQIENFADGTSSVNDCFKPVSRYFDRITRPEQLLTALPRAFRVMTDAADCGPATLSLCQDVQAEAYDFPVQFFEPNIWSVRRLSPVQSELDVVSSLIKGGRSSVIIAGGGIHYSQATDSLRNFAEKHQIPVVETQAGKSALPWDHPLNFGPVGVTGGEPANSICEEADIILGVGTRFQDFTTGSWSLFKNPNRKLISLNVAAYDAQKHGAVPLLADALAGLNALSEKLSSFKMEAPSQSLKRDWFIKTDKLTNMPETENNLATDMQVIGAVQRESGENTVVMCAAGTMPGELHKLWKAGNPGSYHMEYGFSCMGYEIAGALGIKMADPMRDVICFTGDGTYMMANSELATAAMMKIDFTVIITDNRGFGCINRLQMGTGGAEFNNLFEHAYMGENSSIDFTLHAASMGATAKKVASIKELEEALSNRHSISGPYVIVIDTDPYPSTAYGGTWWDVAVPEVSKRTEVNEKFEAYVQSKPNR